MSCLYAINAALNSWWFFSSSIIHTMSWEYSLHFENDVCICTLHCEYLTIPDAFSLPLFNSQIGILYAAIRSKHQLDGLWIQPITSLHVQQAHLSPPVQVTDLLYCPLEVRVGLVCSKKHIFVISLFISHNYQCYWCIVCICVLLFLCQTVPNRKYRQHHCWSCLDVMWCVSVVNMVNKNNKNVVI